MSDYLRVCEKAARKAGAVLLDWQGRFKVQEKGPADLVTEADLAAERIIRETVLTAFPDHEFVGEEDTHSNETGWGRIGQPEGFRWVVDPLDGTTNYVHSLAQFCVSIALEHGGEIIVGTIFDPVSGNCYTAESGNGAFCNGDPISVSNVSCLKDSLASVSFPASVDSEAVEVSRFLRMLPHCQAIRRIGSTALNLCYLASGQLDVYWTTSTKPWDVAAGVLLVREAGGVVTDIDGGPFQLATGRFATACGESLHSQLIKCLAEGSPTSR